jgi:hypothetical protein
VDLQQQDSSEKRQADEGGLHVLTNVFATHHSSSLLFGWGIIYETFCLTGSQDKVSSGCGSLSLVPALTMGFPLMKITQTDRYY